MAEYIEDTGSNGHDAILSGDYTTDAPNKTLSMNDGTAEADTGFVLPSSSEWLLIETYDVEDVSGDLGYHWWKSNVADVDASLLAFRNIVDAEYTLYKMKGTHYLGNGTADVYEANNTTAFPTTADNEAVDYTPDAGNWLITDTLIAPISGFAELISWGTFSNDPADLDGFTLSLPSNGATIDIVAGEMVLTNGTDGQVSGYKLESAIVTIGTSYEIIFESSDNSYLVIGKEALNAEYGYNMRPTDGTIIFQAVTTDVWFGFKNLTSTPSADAIYDNVSVKESLEKFGWGQFNAGSTYSAWTKTTTNGTLGGVSGELVITNGNDGNCRGKRTQTVASGETYLLNFDSSDTSWVILGSTDNGTEYTVGVQPADCPFEFTTTSTSLFIQMDNGSAVDAEDGHWDNVSLKVK